MSQRQLRNTARVIGFIAMCAYLVILGYLVFFSETFGGNIAHVNQYNLIPFHTINNFIQYRDSVSVSAWVVNLIGNIVAFMPFGIILPIILRQNYHKYYIQWVLFWAFMLSLTIEITQYLMSVGAFDVDDLILNTFGAILGYLFYLYVRRGFKGAMNRKSSR